MSIDRFHIILILLCILFITLLLNTKNDIKYITNTYTEVKYDTIYATNTKYDTIYQKIKYNTITTKYDTIYETIFKDTNYVMNIYSKCPTDSIEFKIEYEKEIVTHLNTPKIDYKNELGILYQYNGNSVVNAMYGRNINRITPFISTGMDINEKKPIIGLGLKLYF